MKDISFETKAIHGGLRPSQSGDPSTVPIHISAGFEYQTAEEMEEVFEGRRYGHVYSRISNPSMYDFEMRLNALESGIGACAVASGMAAISATIFALVIPGDEIVSSESLFGGTFAFFSSIAERIGIKVRYADFTDPKNLQNLFNDKTKLIFCETIGNPKLDVPNVRTLSKIAAGAAIPLVVDSTLTTPYLFRAKELGAAIAIHSTTKYITGNGSLMGGAIVDTGTFDWSRTKSAFVRETSGFVPPPLAFLQTVRKKIIQNMGACASPFNAALASFGIETLSLRMEKHCSNAARLAEALDSSERSMQVNYPGLPGNPHHRIASEQFGGRFGGILTLRLGSKSRAFTFMNSLKYARKLANIGDTKTLVIHPASTIYHDCTAKERESAGVTDDLVRVSVGIENPDDIIDDFMTACKEAS